VHLVCFIIRIYHDAWSSECQSIDILLKNTLSRTSSYSDAILHLRQTQFGICLYCVKFYHFFSVLVSWSASSGSYRRFLSHLHYSNDNVLNYLKLHTLSARRRYGFLTDVFSVSKHSPAVFGKYLPT